MIPGKSIVSLRLWWARERIARGHRKAIRLYGKLAKIEGSVDVAWDRYWELYGKHKKL